MKNTLFRLLGLGQTQRARPTDANGLSIPPATTPDTQDTQNGRNTQQHSDVQRELVRVVLKDTLRQHGIPSSWIGCEVTVLSRPAPSSAGNAAALNARQAPVARERLFVHLIVMKWNDALVRFAPALQQMLMQALDRFEPVVDHANYIVSWRFSPESGCPYKGMPDPMFWSQDAIAPMAQPVPALSRPALAPDAAAASVAPPPKPKFDLPPSSLDNIPSGFAPTEPGPLR